MCALCCRFARAYNQYCPYFCVAYSSSLPYLNRGPSSHLVVVRNRGADGSYTLYHTKGADYRVGCTRSTIQSTLVRGLIGAEQNTKQREKLRFRIPDLSVSGADISPSLPSGVSQDYVQEDTRRSPHRASRRLAEFGSSLTEKRSNSVPRIRPVPGLLTCAELDVVNGVFLRIWLRG